MDAESIAVRAAFDRWWNEKIALRIINVPGREQEYKQIAQMAWIAAHLARVKADAGG